MSPGKEARDASTTHEHGRADYANRAEREAKQELSSIVSILAAVVRDSMCLRRRVALGLRKLRNKQLENPWKKHDNIPL